MVTATRRFSQRWGFLGQLYAVEREGQLHRLPEHVSPARQRAGTRSADPNGLPLGFDPDRERGPSLQDQRHHLVMSGLYVATLRHQYLNGHAVGSGRPYNILAGEDLNGDGNGGAIPGPIAR